MAEPYFIKKVGPEWGVFRRLAEAWSTDWSKVWLNHYVSEKGKESGDRMFKKYPTYNRVYVQVAPGSFRHSFPTQAEANTALEWHRFQIAGTPRGYQRGPRL